VPKTDSFDKNGNRHEAWFGRNMPVFRSELDAVGDLLPSGKAPEIGLGTSRFAASFGVRFGESDFDYGRFPRIYVPDDIKEFRKRIIKKTETGCKT